MDDKNRNVELASYLRRNASELKEGGSVFISSSFPQSFFEALEWYDHDGDLYLNITPTTKPPCHKAQ